MAGWNALAVDVKWVVASLLGSSSSFHSMIEACSQSCCSLMMMRKMWKTVQLDTWTGYAVAVPTRFVCVVDKSGAQTDAIGLAHSSCVSKLRNTPRASCRRRRNQTPEKSIALSRTSSLVPSFVRCILRLTPNHES